MTGNGKAPPPYFDEKQNAMVQEDVHLMDVNLKAAVQTEYHTYSVESLEQNVESLDENIKVFRAHIKKEEERKDELLALIIEGKERDKKLAEIGF